MSIVFFSTRTDKTGEAIMEAVKTRLSEEHMDLCETSGDLTFKLTEHLEEKKAAILVPEDEAKLIDIYAMKKLLSRVPILLVLPGRGRFVEALGYGLRPRLICHRDADIGEVASKITNTLDGLRRASGGAFLRHRQHTRTQKNDGGLQNDQRKSKKTCNLPIARTGSQ